MNGNKLAFQVYKISHQLSKTVPHVQMDSLTFRNMLEIICFLEASDIFCELLPGFKLLLQKVAFVEQHDERDIR